MTHYKIKTLLVFCLLLLLGETGAATELVDIRTGSHLRFSRVVMEFNRNVQFQIEKNQQASTISVTARPVQAMAEIGQVEVDSTDTCIRSVTRTLSKQGLSVQIDLHSPYVKLRHYTMRHPFRVVIDISPENKKSPPETAPEPAEFVPVAKNPDKQPEAVQPVMTDSQVETASAELTPNAPDSSGIAKVALFTDPKERNALAARFDSLSRNVEEKLGEIFKMPGPDSETKIPEQAADNAEQNVAVASVPQKKPIRSSLDLSFTFLAILGFLLIDVVLIMYYFAIRKKKAGMPITTKIKKQAPPVQQTQVKKEPVLENKQPQTVVPEEKEEQIPESFEDPGSDFIAALTTMLDSGSGEIELPTVESDRELDEINGIKQAVKVDTMIASLSEAITKPAAEIQYIPELEDVLNDLETVSSTPGSMRDMSRNELLGRDGEAFLNNIRRDSFF